MFIFVEADEPLLIFDSIQMAERYLETEDVRNGAYPRAFGPSGEQYSLTVDGERVIIERLAAPLDPGGLEHLLRNALHAVGEPAPDDADLPALIAAADAFWSERDPYGDRFGTSIPAWGCLAAVAGIAGVAAMVWG